MNKKVGVVLGGLGVGLAALALARRGGATPGVELEVLFLSVSPSQVEAGQEVVATATVTNRGTAGKGSVIFRVNGQSTARSITLDAGETADVQLVIRPAAAGEYTVQCDGQTALFIATEPPPGEGLVIENVSCPSSVPVGTRYDVAFDVVNQGDAQETYWQVAVASKGDAVDGPYGAVTLNPGQSKHYSFSLTGYSIVSSGLVQFYVDYEELWRQPISFV